MSWRAPWDSQPDGLSAYPVGPGSAETNGAQLDGVTTK